MHGPGFIPAAPNTECPPGGYAETILHTEYSIGKAAAALEVITALADAGDVFSVFDKTQSAGLADSMRNVQAAYTVRSAELEDLCRRHGMDEVAYQHG